MKILAFREALLAAGLLLLAVPACAQMGKPAGKSPVRPLSGKAAPDVEAMLRDACYKGIETDKDVCLKDGRSAGPPVVVLGGRAPQFRWGQGSLQEIDHVPFVRPLVKLAATAAETAEIPGLVDEALQSALRSRSGPV